MREQPVGRTRFPWWFGLPSLVFLLILGFTPGLAAQTPGGLDSGARSLSFGIDGGGTAEAGIWLFVTDRTNLGLLGSLNWFSEDRRNEDHRSGLGLTLGPRAKWYLASSGSTAPFWYGGIDFGHVRDSRQGRDDRTGRVLGLEAGFGVDWFPLDRFSLGGWTGLRLQDERLPSDDTRTRLDTFTTGLRVHLYFF